MTHMGFTAPPFFSYRYPPLHYSLLLLTVDNDGCDPKAPDPFSQGSPPLHHPELHLHAPSSTRSNALRAGTVSFTLHLPIAFRIV